MKYLELLAPAKNLECGIAAIDHGADAVYIGAERFGARQAAGNSTDDIETLCKYAHTFRAKVYVTVNTIIYNNELEDTQTLINSLYRAGVDAILVQDMGILEMELPPIALHASTQTDNRSAEKVAWLAAHGFSRAVLARELSLAEIEEIHRAVPDIEIEAFVHGALCVSYSGQCYASQYCFGRSANRGECAQFCRLKFDLEDTDGNIIEHNRHLLSLKDMCRIEHLEQMAKAGVSSFKIEGRLKDINYVKNVTAAYSQKLNEIIKNNPGLYCRASLGRCQYTFTPCLNKTFNRGFTNYFLTEKHSSERHGNTVTAHNDITSFDTPKAMGEYVGYVKETKGTTFTVAGTAKFANGDGLCFINDKHELEGFRVNKAEANRIFPLKMPKGIRRGVRLYRNNDKAFENVLSKPSATRKIDIAITLSEKADGFSVAASIPDIHDGLSETGTASVSLTAEKQTAMKPQRENIVRQMSKLGNTPFECVKVTFVPQDFKFFIPSSILSEMRRQVTEKLKDSLLHTGNSASDVPHTKSSSGHVMPSGQAAPPVLHGKEWLLNISNKLARKFYADEGISHLADAFELKQPDEPLLMQCRHCLRRSLGHCTKNGGTPPQWHEPLYLVMSDGRRFRLQFDCKECKMNIYDEK